MHHPKHLILLVYLVLSLTTTAQDLPDRETITRHASDDIALVADFYAGPADAPVIIALHMLNSERAAYAPLIPDLQAAGYALLNVDMRGHGASGGARDWDAAIADIADWIAWLEAEGHLNESGLAIMGASIGANVAIISCAESAVCAGAIALSPGLDYRGVKPEAALVDGLADRAALLVAAGRDQSSATAIRQMFLKAQGAVTAHMYSGRAHGTRLFESEYESVSQLILHWLREHIPVNHAPSKDDECNPDNYQFGKRGYILCSSIPRAMKPITADHCLYEHMDDRDNDGVVCEIDRS